MILYYKNIINYISCINYINRMSSYQIMDRIGFIKSMISTHQKKLVTLECERPKRCSSHLETS